MAKQSKKQSAKNEETLALLEAVRAATSIQKGSGLTERQTHCLFINGYVVATNDTIIFGVPARGIEFNCCPHSKTLLAALERCEKEVSFTYDNGKLVVKSGRIRVTVPCIDPSALLDLRPDQRQGDADPRLAAALGVLAVLPDPNDPKAVARAVYVAPGVATASHRGITAMQIWHGVDPCPTVALPVVTAQSVAKHKAVLVGMGTDIGTITFWFDDSSFIRSRLFDQASPNWDKVLNHTGAEKPCDISIEFFDAIEAMLPFVPENTKQVTLESGKVWAGAPESGLGEYDFENLPFEDCAFNGEYLATVKGLAKSVIYDPFLRKLYYFGDNLRGAIMGLHYVTKQEREENETPF